MKNQKITTLLIALFAFTMSFGQSEVDSTGLLGDNFSLEGALECFKNSKDLEDFEKRLNKEDSYTNNLDLNDDDKIDYIKVIDNMDGDHHAIVLQVDISKDESQDIAVIEIEKDGDESAILQIVGDELLYGPEKYVEPFDIEAESNGRGPNGDIVTLDRIVVNVWGWPTVRFVYGPRYRVYTSPWRWGYYPTYWKPWRPHPWRWHFNKRSTFRVHYHTVRTHRVVRAHKVYTPKRRTSTVVRTKSVNRTVVKRGNKTAVRTTRTNTTAVKNKRGNKSAVKKSKTKKVKGNKAAVKKTKTKSVRKKKG